MAADFKLVAGDLLPLFEDQLKYSNGAVAEPESVAFVMRSLTAQEKVTLAGESKVVSKTKGEVSFTPGAGDSTSPGNYMANWVAKVAGKQMTFPTTGYLWVEIQPNLESKGGQQLVGLPEVKDYLNIQESDHTHDTKLVAHIEAVAPLIEEITGPIMIRVYEEWHDGGHATIALRHPPNVGFGTSPVLFLMACSEYRGPIEYIQSGGATPTQGSVYSVMADARMGTITRRTSGGGTVEFWRDPLHGKQTVHVVYAAGQEKVPTNVRMAVLETIRVSYETTMLVGRGFQTVADQQEAAATLPYYLPRRALELLAPTRRAPAIA